MSDNPYKTPIDSERAVNRSRWIRSLVGISLLSVVVLLGIALLLPSVRFAGPAAERTQCLNNLKQILLALHNYHDHFGAFPPAYTVDENGQPLHSWRTLILPYLEEEKLYRSIDLSKPWDDPANAKARRSHPGVYRCPSTDLRKGLTAYVAISEPNALLYGGVPRKETDVTDGLSNTLVVVEVPESAAVHWMAPRDADLEALLSINSEIEVPHDWVFTAALGDGSVHPIRVDTSDDVRRALVTIDGGEEASFH